MEDCLDKLDKYYWVYLGNKEFPELRVRANIRVCSISSEVFPADVNKNNEPLWKKIRSILDDVVIWHRGGLPFHHMCLGKNIGQTIRSLRHAGISVREA